MHWPLRSAKPVLRTKMYRGMMGLVRTLVQGDWRDIEDRPSTVRCTGAKLALLVEDVLRRSERASRAGGGALKPRPQPELGWASGTMGRRRCKADLAEYLVVPGWDIGQAGYRKLRHDTRPDPNGCQVFRFRPRTDPPRSLGHELAGGLQCAATTSVVPI